MSTVIITGTSRGLGQALAEQYICAGHQVIGISRTPSESLKSKAEQAEALYNELIYDLNETEGLTDLMEQALHLVDRTLVQTKVTLIHNAGLIEPIGPIGLTDERELVKSLQVNLTAPMVLSSAFVRFTNGWSPVGRRTVLSISSGAGKKPYSGWAAYCAGKAGIDMLVRCAGLEQGNSEGAVRFLSLAPGVMDTDMQVKIRQTDTELFPSQPRFQALKKAGDLLTPEFAAERIIHLLEHGKWEQGAVLDIRDFLT